MNQIQKRHMSLAAMTGAAISALFWFSLNGQVITQSNSAPLENAKRISVLTDNQITESSGLVLSQRNQDCFWTHNDSGDSPRLFLVHRDGRTIARVAISGAKAVDWEDIAIAEIDGQSKIVVGDIGGNARKRNSVTLYMLTEPSIAIDDNPNAKPIETTVEIDSAIEVQFKSGVTDYEGIAIDTENSSVLIVEKSLLGGRVYTVSMPESSAENATKNATKKIIRAASELVRTSVPFATACDISSDNSSMVMITYNFGFLFTRQIDDNGRLEDWSTALAREPLTFSLPVLKQTEAVCFSADAKSIYITSESLPTPIFQIDLPSSIAPLPE